MTARRAGNLPGDVTSFVGRARATTQVKRLLSISRMVTLTGVAGVGKTRLALHVANRLRRAFPDGVWLVELARLRERGALAPAVVNALGLNTQSARDPEQVLLDYLADKRALLVLDDCEYVLDDCGRLVSALLESAPEVRVLVTSRAPLGISGEHSWPVPPLSVPVLDGAGTGADTARVSEALALFEDRAAAVLPGFTVGPKNERAVARLCHHLDGLPLAIELAAVRMRSLSVDEIVSHLEDRYGLLTVGDRSALPHHRTLRAAIEWSYDLCSETERILWARLSVFAGAFDLAAAEEVCEGDGVSAEDVFTAVAGLVEKSVLVREGRQQVPARYRLLETIREYGREWLTAGTEELVLRRRHRDHYLRSAQRVDAEWFGPHQVERLTRLRQDRENLRAALEFCASEPSEALEGLRMANALRFYWLAGGAMRDGRYWLRTALSNAPDPTPERARALAIEGLIVATQGDTTSGLERLKESRELADRLGDAAAVTSAVHVTGAIEVLRGEQPSAVRQLEEPLQDDLAVAVDEFALVSAPTFATAFVLLGNPARAVAMCERWQAICAEHGELWMTSWVRLVLGLARWTQQDLNSASEDLREALRLKQLFNDVAGILLCLEMLSWIAGALDQTNRAATLLGATRQLWKPFGTHLFGIEPYMRWHFQCESRVRRALGDRELQAAEQRGAQFTMDQAVAYALGKGTVPRSWTGGSGPRLTRREQEVARLVAQGMSNRQIADQLVISKRTSDGHIEHILNKLGFTSRAQIAAWVAEEESNSGSADAQSSEAGGVRGRR